jgi:hypothetical protein
MRTKRLAKALIRPVSPLMIGCNELGFDSALRAFDPSI